MKPEKTKHFQHGYDSEMNGANETNCHFSLFNTPENTKLWEAGRDKAKQDKLKSKK